MAGEPALDQLATSGRLVRHLPVAAGAPQFTTHKHTKMCQVKTDFGTYLKYVADPSQVDVLFAGRWSKGDANVLRDLNLPLYCGNLRIARHSKDKVFADIDSTDTRAIGILEQRDSLLLSVRKSRVVVREPRRCADAAP